MSHSCNDVLTDCTLVGKLFAKRLREAAGESIKHTEIFMDFRTVFPAEKVHEFDEIINKWNQNPDSVPSPYGDVNHGSYLIIKKLFTNNKVSIGTTMLQLRKELAEAERFESAQGNMYPDSISASHWLSVGIELEDLQ